MSKLKCRNCGAKLIFGPRSYFKKYCDARCRTQYNDAHRQVRSGHKTFAERSMARYGAPVSLVFTALDLKWLAAFWDAEGSIGINKIRTTRKGVVWRPMMQTGNTNKLLIDEVIRLIGKQNVHINVSKPRSPKHKPCVRANIAHRAMRSFVEQLLPFLIGKKRQAELMCEFFRLQDASLITTDNSEQYARISDACARLNRRGL